MDTRLVDAVKVLFFQLVGGSEPPIRWALAVVIGFLVAAGVLAWVLSRMSEGSVLLRSALPVLLLDAALLLASAAATREFLCPYVRFTSPFWVTVAVVVLVFLVLVLPLTARLLSTGQVATLVGLLAAALTLILLFYLITLGYDTITHGNANIKARRTQRQNEERALNY